MIFLILACSSGVDSGGACDRDPPLTYANFGQAWMGKHCTGCHGSLVRDDLREGAPVGVDVDTLDGVRQWAERIQVRSVERTMPPGGGPTQEELEMLDEWLSCAVIE